MSADEQPTTFDLIERAQRGDAAALDELMRTHLASLRAFVRARTSADLRRREADSDLVQTVCREALRSLGDYKWQGEGSFRLWLFSLTLNKLRNKHDYHYAQKRDRHREVSGPQGYERLATAYRTVSTPSENAIARELVDKVEAALDRLEPAQRDVIVLSRIVGLSHKEIGEQLGKSEGAARTALNRALAKLASAMQAVERERGGPGSPVPPL